MSIQCILFVYLFPQILFVICNNPSCAFYIFATYLSDVLTFSSIVICRAYKRKSILATFEKDILHILTFPIIECIITIRFR